MKPRPLKDAWPEIEALIHQRDHLAVLTDFDGTLAEIRRFPWEVEMPPRIRRLLKDLRDRGALVGVVSGRTLADLEALVRIPNIWYAGEHGMFVQRPNGERIPMADAAHLDRIERVRQLLGERLKDVPGVRVEAKHAAVAVHYRGAHRDRIETGRKIVNRAASEIGGLDVMQGKMVWDIVPLTAIDKGTAVKTILQEAALQRPGSWLPVFLGDDTTDENVFTKMTDGITVAVGQPRDTAARFFVPSPSEVADFLSRLAKELGNRE